MLRKQSFFVKFCNMDFLSCLQVLSEENQRHIVDFAKQEGLVLLADEVNGSLLKILDTQLNLFKTWLHFMNLGNEGY